MNGKQFATIRLLIFSLSIGAAFANPLWAWAGTINKGETPSLKQIRYTINTDEVQGATTIWDDLFGKRTALRGNATGEYMLSEPLSENHPIAFVSISVPSVGMIGQDVLIWQAKEALIFNGENTAITEALTGLVSFGATEQQLVQAYPLIRTHPKLSELKQVMLAEKGYPTSDNLLDKNAKLSFEIAAEVMQAIRVRNAPPNS